MREVTIWIEDDHTGNKVQIEHGDVKSAEHLQHLSRTAWNALLEANDRPGVDFPTERIIDAEHESVPVASPEYPGGIRPDQ